MASQATFPHGSFQFLYHLPETLCLNIFAVSTNHQPSNVNKNLIYSSLLFPSSHHVQAPQICLTISGALWMCVCVCMYVCMFIVTQVATAGPYKSLIDWLTDSVEPIHTKDTIWRAVHPVTHSCNTPAVHSPLTQLAWLHTSAGHFIASVHSPCAAKNCSSVVQLLHSIAT